MIIAPTFFLILAILPTVTEQTLRYSSKKSPIDWSKCPSENKCFCEDSGTIKEMSSEVNNEDNPDSNVPRVDGDVGKCNIGSQLRLFTEQTALFQFQKIGSSMDLREEQQLMFALGSIKIGCKFSNGKVTVDGDVPMINKFRISIFENRSKCERGYCLCALKIERVHRLKTEVANNRYNNAYGQLSLISLASGQPPIPDDTPFIKGKGMLEGRSSTERCDPYTFKDLSASPIYDVLPVINRDVDVMNCKSHGPPPYTMRYEAVDDNKQKIEGELSELKCIGTIDPNTGESTFAYTMVKTTIDETTQLPEEAPLPADATVYCAAKVEDVCENPNNNCPVAQECPTFTPPTNGASAKLKCTGDKWLINDEYYDNFEAGGGEGTCKQDIITKKSAFFITPKGSSDKKVGDLNEAKCFTDYDCVKKSKLSVPGCDDFTNCDSVSYDAGTLSCSNTSISLSIIPPRTNVSSSATSIKCDPATGTWVNASGSTQEPILTNSRLRCFVKKNMVERVEADLSSAQITSYIAGTFFAVLVVVAIVCLIFFAVKKKEILLGELSPKAWKKKKKADKIAECKEVFESIMSANGKKFEDGLELLDLMLETETTEPECWDYAWPFLTRFRLTLRKTDFQCWHMFARYMYLQAKKIIDKHGWISKESSSKASFYVLSNPCALQRRSQSISRRAR